MKGSRRKFVAGSVGGGLAGLASAQADEAVSEIKKVNPQVDRRMFGSTGAEVSIYGLGLGSVFTKPNTDHPEQARAIVERALDFGINYWDTARAYSKSEELIGPVVEKRRKEIFLVSKTGAKDYDGYMRDLELSLKNLKTDYLDLYHLHNFNPGAGDTDAKAREGAYRAALKAKEQGMIKNFGVTGHSGTAILIEVINAYNPDALLTTFPANRPEEGRYEDELLPLAVSKKMAVIAMKTVRHVRNSDLPPSELIRYALSLPGISTAIVGTGEIDHLESNARLATNFKSLNSSGRSDLSKKVAANIPAQLPQPWDLPGYNDVVV